MKKTNTTKEVKTETTATEVKETKTVEKEKKVTDKMTRNLLASNLMADIKEPVDKAAEFDFDNTSNCVRRYSYYIGIRFAGKSTKLMSIWPHASFLDICLTKKLADQFKEACPDALKGINVIENGAVTAWEIGGEGTTIEEIRKSAVDLILKAMEVLKPVAKEEKTEKAPAPKTDKKPAGKKGGKKKSEPKSDTETQESKPENEEIPQF